MTEVDLKAIQARVNAATPGPWRTEDHRPNLTRYVLSEDGTLDISFGYVGNRTEPDAVFVAAARTDVPALLALVAEQAEQIARVRALHEPEDRGLGFLECRGCRNPVFTQEWPCPTIIALDDEPESGETP